MLRPPHPPRRGGRRIGVLLTVALLVIAAAAVEWLRSESADPPSPVSPSQVEVTRPAASVAAAPLDTIGIEHRVSPPRPPRPPTVMRSRPAPRRAAQPRPTPPPVRVTPLAPGRLFVGATPWGDLYVDGQLVGHTPITGVAITAGAHRLRIVRDGFQPFDQVIQVTSGQDFRLTDIALRALAP